MGFKQNIFLCFCASILMNCCKTDQPVPINDDTKLDLNAFDHWANDTTKKWVFAVYTYENSNLKYLYDDTLHFVKDTNIYPPGNPNKKYFKHYTFYKNPNQHKFIVGNYPNYSEKLIISLSGLNFDLFDLYNIQDSGQFKSFKMDGSPIDDRYLVKYTSPFNKNRQTAIGKFTTIISSITFNETYPNNGKYHYFKQLEIAKNTGLVRYDFDFEQTNVSTSSDTTYKLTYTIKEIIEK